MGRGLVSGQIPSELVVLRLRLEWNQEKHRSGPGGRSSASAGGRKVRAPQDTVVGNAHRLQSPGKCNRKQTASPRFGAAR